MHLEYDYPIVALMTITLQTSPMDKDTLFKGTKIHQIKVQRNTKSRTKIHQNAFFCFYQDKDWSMTQIVVFQPKYSKITKKYFVPLSLASSSPSITHFINLQSHLDLPSPTLPFPPIYRAFLLPQIAPQIGGWLYLLVWSWLCSRNYCGTFENINRKMSN